MQTAPCVLFIDEIDAITQRRENAQKGMESRIVGQLLACMDNLNSKGNEKEGQVVVIGATNRPDSLDPALRRAGRFEREIAMGIPDAEARLEILKVLTPAPACSHLKVLTTQQRRSSCYSQLTHELVLAS